MASSPDTERCPVSGGALAADATLLDPKILARPNAMYAALRTQDPVHYDPQLSMYVVSRYEDIQKVLLDADNFSMEKGYHASFVKGYADEFKEILRRDGGGFYPDDIMTDPPKHTRPRRLLEKVFTAHRIKTLEPRIRGHVVDVIEGIADKGRMDAVKDFALPLTVTITCEQMGLGQVDKERIHRWAISAGATLGHMNSREDMLKIAKDMCDLQHFLEARVRERRENRTEDLLSDLIYARIDDDANPSLRQEEIMALARVLLVGGNETTSTALSTLLWVLATEPAITQQLRECADDERLLNRFTEELIRYEPPVRALARMTTREVELGGKTLPAGAHVLMLFASGNDDEKEFACARDFDPNRPNIGRHLSFGAGVHRCVGMALARMEVKVAAKELIERLDNFKLAVPEEEIVYHPTVAIRSIASLPMTFTRRAR